MPVRISSQPRRRTKIDPSLYLETTDETLMQLFQGGDALAFHALLERHRGLLWKIARKYFGPQADIDDLVQDLTLTLWQKKDAWIPGSARFSTWLYRVAANRCIDVLRQKQILSHDGILPDHIATHVPNAEDNLERQQLADQLGKLLGELPGNQKTALTLYYYEEATMPQIAERLGVSELAARSLLKRGKQTLRERIPAHS